MSNLREITSKSIVNNLNTECKDSLFETYRNKYIVYSAYAKWPAAIRFLGEIFKDKDVETCNMLISVTNWRQHLKKQPKPFFIPHVLSPDFPIDKVYIIGSQENDQAIHVTNDLKMFKVMARSFSGDLKVVDVSGLVLQASDDEDDEEFEERESKFEHLYRDEPHRYMLTVK